MPDEYMKRNYYKMCEVEGTEGKFYFRLVGPKKTTVFPKGDEEHGFMVESCLIKNVEVDEDKKKAKSAEINKESSLKNREARNKATMVYYYKNRDARLKEMHDYKERNKEKLVVYDKKYREENKELLRQRSKDGHKKFREKERAHCRAHREDRIADRKRIKTKVFEHYSGGDIKCKKCGNVDMKVLCLDHINFVPISEKRKDNYWSLMVRGYPEGFQVLCYNCNFRKRSEDNELFKGRKSERQYVVNVRYQEKLKRQTFEAYGGAKCKDCGELDLRVLCLDHIHGGGGKEQRERGTSGKNFYLSLKKASFPRKDEFQVLCCNCNRLKSIEKGEWLNAYKGKGE